MLHSQAEIPKQFHGREMKFTGHTDPVRSCSNPPVELYIFRKLPSSLCSPDVIPFYVQVLLAISGGALYADIHKPSFFLFQVVPPCVLSASLVVRCVNFPQRAFLLSTI